VGAVETRLRLHPDTQRLDDEWAGITDPILRRKLQNRLNQRAARRRKMVKPALNGAREEPALSVILADRAKAAQKWLNPIDGDEVTPTTFQSVRLASKCSKPLPADVMHERLQRVNALHERILAEKDSRALYPLPADHLLSLVYYNVYRVREHAPPISRFSDQALGLDRKRCPPRTRSGSHGDGRLSVSFHTLLAKCQFGHTLLAAVPTSISTSASSRSPSSMGRGAYTAMPGKHLTTLRRYGPR
jgi:hypothetical protein